MVSTKTQKEFMSGKSIESNLVFSSPLPNFQERVAVFTKSLLNVGRSLFFEVFEMIFDFSLKRAALV